MLALLPFSFFFFYSLAAHRYLHSFPTRRSSDLICGTPACSSSAQASCSTPSARICRTSRAASNASRRRRRRARSRRLSRSEEHTSELQSRVDLVCRLLLEKKKKKQQMTANKK